MFAPAWVSERVKKSVAPVKTHLRDLYKNIKNSGDQFPGFWLSHLSVLLISWDDIIERFIWNIISSMCQFYHICFSNLSCQLILVGTAGGCDTEKQLLSQKSNFYDPGWELSLFIYLFILWYQATSPLHLYVILLTQILPSSYLIWKFLLRQSPIGNTQTLFWVDSAFAGTTVMINGNSFRCQSNTTEPSTALTTEGIAEFIWFGL